MRTLIFVCLCLISIFVCVVAGLVSAFANTPYTPTLLSLSLVLLAIGWLTAIIARKLDPKPQASYPTGVACPHDLSS
jgi:hypothetical protein